MHYHFLTKESLAAAVARRYAERFLATVEQEIATGRSLIEAWIEVFRRSLHDDGKMCLCGALGAMSYGLPEEVSREVRRFFQQGLEKLMEAGLSRTKAVQVMASLEGEGCRWRISFRCRPDDAAASLS